VTKRFTKEIAEEFKQKVVTKAYRGALEKEKLEVLNVVSVEEGKIEPGLSAAITVTVDVRPEFTLPEYVGLPTQVGPVIRPTPRSTASSRDCAPSARISSPRNVRPPRATT
jgi:trigger factor